MASTYNLLTLSEEGRGGKSSFELRGEFRANSGTNSNAMMSCITYTVCSVGMVLANKAISASLEEDVRKEVPQLSVIAFQCLVAVGCVQLAKAWKYVEYPDFDWKIAKAWLPLNILFIGMLCTGFLSLVHNNVPMVTVCKNLTNVVTIAGDALFFGEKVSVLTVLSIFIMVLGAVLAGANDLEFSFIGYACMGLNCFFTSGYVLYMRFVSTTVKVPKFGMVFYNNLLSVGLLIPLILYMDEIPQWFNPRIMTSSFILNNILAGFLGFYLNFASLWCVSTTSATTYAVVGSVNKVPITILGFILFNTAMTSEGILFITLATCGGFIYAYSKFKENENK
jgi:GDP-mannose transporter